MHPDWQQHIKKGKVYRHFSDKYVSPKGFAPWNETVSLFALTSDPVILQRVCSSHNARDVQPMVDCAYATNMAGALDAPAVYIERNLAEAIIYTDVSPMERPNKVLPAFFICLPRKLLYDDDNLEIYSVLVIENAAYMIGAATMANVPKEQADKAWNEAKKDNQLTDLRIFAINKHGAVITAPSSWSKSTLVDDADRQNVYFDYIHNNEIQQHDFLNTLAKLRRLVKNVILIYNYQRDLIKDVQVTVGKGFYRRRTNKTRSPLPATVLGQGFVVREVRASSSDKNTKIRVRPHWRKGHWHTTLCGAGRTERRLKWFQPVYVNASLDT